jgi:hypothetical protein
MRCYTDWDSTQVHIQLLRSPNHTVLVHTLPHSMKYLNFASTQWERGQEHNTQNPIYSHTGG